MRSSFTLLVLAIVASQSAEGSQARSDTSAVQTIVFGSEAGIYSVRSDGAAPKRLTSGRDGGPVLSPERTAIAFTRTRVIGEDFRGDDITTLDLYVMRTDGTGLRRLLPVAYQPDWSPGGRKLAFVRYFGTAATVWTANADGTGMRRLAGAADGGRPDWSPDGRKIAFERWTGRFMEVFVVNADGSGLRRAVRGSRVSGTSPVWSPNGGRLAFASDYLGTDTQDYIYVVDSRAARPRPIPLRTTAIGPIAWAPDGQEIAFAEYLDWNNSPNNEYVYVVPPRAGAHGQKLAGPDAWNPNWSMDGRRIAFVKGQHTIKVMNADGTGVRTVVRLKVTVGSFDW